MASGTHGVYMAGRCLSASHRALASVRVMGTCFATGEASGIAAADHALHLKRPERQIAMIRRAVMSE